MFFPVYGQAPEKPNIIYIFLDDLYDYSESFGGHMQAETPAISQIEQWGTTFVNASSSSPKCAPSRTSFITGKDLFYTQVYKNPACFSFRDYFTSAKNNEEVFTIPEYIKNEGGYFTYGINKIFHCFESFSDYDTLSVDPCEKNLSWNKFIMFPNAEDSTILSFGNPGLGVNFMEWNLIPDSLEHLMYDHQVIDSTISFLQNINCGQQDLCNKPFFLMLGIRKPHTPWYIPEKYFPEYFQTDLNEFPFQSPYNTPLNNFPPNGVIMPPQPDTLFGDYFNLPENGMGQYFANYDSTYYYITNEIQALDPLPEVAPGLSEEERKEILNETIRANATIAYLASIKFVDAQIQRLLDSLENYPAIFSNTIIILTSDHGFSLGEKKHWLKGTLWETDLRVPLIIADLRNPLKQVVNSPVSLLDIFPTICDLTNSPYPVFIDSTNYLDGISLMPLLQNPDLQYERPLLASYMQPENHQCSCFPQYSVRNDKFHYIYYTSNNAEDILDCDHSLSHHEAELYEIGINRETDPNEWNNLISNSDYDPIVEFLQQWLPDSNLYLQKSYKAIINNNALDCFLGPDDTIYLTIEWHEHDGSIVAAPPLFTYKWTNNLTSDIFYGTELDFYTALIDETTFNTENPLMMYLQVYDTLGKLVALDTKYFYIDPDNVPSASFDLYSDTTLEVSITYFTITGDYTSYWWDLGSGPVFHNQIPGPYTFVAPGMQTITLNVEYGNDDCIASFYQSTIITIDGNINYPEFVIYPNPANDLLHISADAQLPDDIYISDIMGRNIKEVKVEVNKTEMVVDVSKFETGLYFISFYSDVYINTLSFIVIHHN